MEKNILNEDHHQQQKTQYSDRNNAQKNQRNSPCVPGYCTLDKSSVCSQAQDESDSYLGRK